MGRKAKPKLSLREMEDEVILKYMNHEPMTLEEAALAMWMYDGRKTKKPMTRMGLLKQEAKIMKKLQKACKAAGIGPEVLELFGAPRRQAVEAKSGAIGYDET